MSEVNNTTKTGGFQILEGGQVQPGGGYHVLEGGKVSPDGGWRVLDAGQVPIQETEQPPGPAYGVTAPAAAPPTPAPGAAPTPIDASGRPIPPLPTVAPEISPGPAPAERPTVAGGGRLYGEDLVGTEIIPGTEKIGGLPGPPRIPIPPGLLAAPRPVVPAREAIPAAGPGPQIQPQEIPPAAPPLIKTATALRTRTTVPPAMPMSTSAVPGTELTGLPGPPAAPIAPGLVAPKVSDKTVAGGFGSGGADLGYVPAEAVPAGEFKAAMAPVLRGPGNLVPIGNTDAKTTINAITRTALGAMSAENLGIMLAAGGLTKAFQLAANAPKVAALLKNYPAVAKAIDIAANAAVPAAFGVTGAVGGVQEAAAGAESKTRQEAISHYVSAATNLLFAGLGAVGAVKAGVETAEAYPIGEVPTEGPQARTRLQTGVSEAERLREQGRNLPATVWMRQAEQAGAGFSKRFGTEPIPVPELDAQINVGGVDRTGRPWYQLVDNKSGKPLASGSPEAVRMYVEAHQPKVQPQDLLPEAIQNEDFNREVFSDFADEVQGLYRDLKASREALQSETPVLDPLGREFPKAELQKVHDNAQQSYNSSWSEAEKLWGPKFTTELKTQIEGVIDEGREPKRLELPEASWATKTTPDQQKALDLRWKLHESEILVRDLKASVETIDRFESGDQVDARPAYQTIADFLKSKGESDTTQGDLAVSMAEADRNVLQEQLSKLPGGGLLVEQPWKLGEQPPQPPTSPTPPLEPPTPPPTPEAPTGLSEGSRVTYMGRKGETLTGTIRSIDSVSGEATVKVDQIAHVAGVPIGRVEYVPLKNLSLYQEQAKPPEQPTPPPTAQTGPRALIDNVKKALDEGESFNNPKFEKLAEESLGGSRAEGTFKMKEAYDGLEAAVNEYLEKGKGLGWTPDAIRGLLSRLPTQATRSHVQEDLQQFSTPPTIAWLADKALNPQKDDVVLEPSAGTGSLVAMLKPLVKAVHVNEIDPGRRALLQEIGFKDATSADAEYLNATLDQSVKPTAIVMNPPFSSTGGRTANKSKFGYAHVTQALERLQDGGRLVAILGRGATMTAPSAMDFWRRVKKDYTLQANIGIAGKEYNKYGTDFGIRLVVIDKAGPTETAPVTGDFNTVEEAYDAIRTIAAARRPPAHGVSEQTQQSVPTLGGGPEQVLGVPGEQPIPPVAPGRGGLHGNDESAGALPGQTPVGPGLQGSTPPAPRPESQTGHGTPGGSRRPGGGGGAPERGQRPQGRVPTVDEVREQAVKDLESLSSKAWQDLNDLLSRGSGTVAMAAPTGKSTQAVLDQVVQLLAVQGAKHFILGAYTYKSWKQGLDPRIKEAAETAADKFGADPEQLLRSVFEASAELAEEIAAKAQQKLSQPPEQPPEQPPQQPEEKIAPPGESQQPTGEQEPNPDETFEPYHATIAGPPHPGPLVETRVMASVTAPTIDYTPNLPKSVIEQGRLSAAQLEVPSRAGMMHRRRDSRNHRLGLLVGDGTGVGKGRELAAIIWDHYRQGHKRALWVSAGKDLINDAARDFGGIDATEFVKKETDNEGNTHWQPVKLFSVNKWKPSEPIALKEGVVFTAYDTLRSRAQGQSGKTRMDQIADWLGPDGVIVFDEAHRAKNAIAGQGRAASLSGEVTVQLQEKLPSAYVTYSSATFATEVRHLAFMDRLGLWGESTAFPMGFSQFLEQVGRGRVAAMELIARELKAAGKFLSRSIAFQGSEPNSTVTFEEVAHDLTAEQRQAYDVAARAWQIVLEKAREQLLKNNAKGTPAQAQLEQYFWNNHQRFFRTLLTAMKVPTIIKLTDAALNDKDNPKSVVISLIGTGQAQAERALQRIVEEGEEEDVDFSPKDILVDLITNNYPTVLYEDFIDEGGQPRKRPVKRDGKVVEDPAAIAARDALIEDVKRNLMLPDSPLGQLISLWGRDKVAELTGRRKTPGRNPKTGAFEMVSRAPEGVALDNINEYEMDMFQSGKKRIAVISKAAGTGISLHSDLDGKNQQKRVHIVMELSWSADDQMQSFGRTHRSNQRYAPEYLIVATDLGGERRFSSTIARRLEALGALTKGQRKASGAANVLAKYNFETDQGEIAATNFYNGLRSGEKNFANSTGVQTLEKMGVIKRNDQGEIIVDERNQLPKIDRDTLTSVTRLMNRILNLESSEQNEVFEYWTSVFDDVVRRAKEAGNLDEGVSLIQGESIEIPEQRTIATDPETSAKTYRYLIEAKRANRPVDVETVKKWVEEGKGHISKERGGANGLIFAERSFVPITDARTGGVRVAFNVARPEHFDINEAKERISAEDLESAYQRFGQEEHDKWKAAVESEKRYKEEVHRLKEAMKSPTPGSYRSESDLKYYQDKLKESEEDKKKHYEAWQEAKKQQFEDWGTAVAARKPYRIEQYHMIGGSVLRVWNLLSSGNRRMDIRMAYPNKGASVVGVVLSEREANRVEEHLTGVRQGQSAAGIINDVLNEGQAVFLAKGIRLFRGTINRRPVVQLSSSDYQIQQFFQSVGVLQERISWQWVNYLPTDNDKAVEILNKILDSYPVEVDAQEGEEGQPGGRSPRFAGAAPILNIGPQNVLQIKPISKREVMAEIRERLAHVPIRTRNFRQRALGVFKIKPEVIRMKRGPYDFPVLSHELGHYINKYLWGTSPNGNLETRTLRPYRKEIAALDYDQKQRRLFEGFAEFMRYYLTEPPMAQEKAPRFLAFFEAELNKHPELKQLLTVTQDNVRRWGMQPAYARVLGSISVDEKRPRRKYGWWKDFGDFYRDMIDDLDPIKEAVEEMSKRSGPVPAEMDAYKLARLLSGWWGMAEEFLEYKTRKFGTLETTGPSLKAILDPVKDQLEPLRAYLVSRRALEKIAQGKDVGIAKRDAEETLTQTESTLFRDTAEKLYAYQNQVLRYLLDAGALTQSEYLKIREYNKEYVPFYRVFMVDEEGETGSRMGGRKFVDLGQPVHRLKGSLAPIMDPLESIVKNTYTLIYFAQRARVAKVFVDQANKTDGAGQFIEKVDLPAVPTRFQLGEISKVLSDAGADVDNLDLSTIATIFRPQKYAPAGSNIVTVIENGKRNFYQVSAELYRALTALDEQQVGVFASLMASPFGTALKVPARLLRLGATGISPEFVIRNPIRDAMDAFMQSRTGFKPGVDSIRGLMHVIKRDDLYHEWKASGAEHAAMVSLDRSTLQSHLKDLLANGVAYWTRHPIEALRFLGETTEAATRLGEYERARKKGMSPAEAALTARDVTIDFARMGRLGRAINPIIAFWNANVQGMDIFARLHDPRDPKRLMSTVLKGIVGITLPTILLYLLNRDDPDYWETPAWQRDFFWLIPTRGMGPVHDLTKFILIPKPFLWGMVYATVPERALEWVETRDPQALDNLWGSAWNVAMPEWLPTAVVPFLEVFADKSRLTGQRLTPAYLENLPTQYQAKPQTTQFSRHMSKALDKVGLQHTFGIDWSPIKLDQVLFGWTGGAGKAVARGIDLLVGGSNQPSATAADIPMLRAFITRSPNPQAVSVERLYDRIGELSKKAKAASAKFQETHPGLIEEGAESLSPQESDELARLNGANKELRALHAEVRQTYGMRMSPPQKRARIEGLTTQMIQVARQALGSQAPGYAVTNR